MRNEVQEFLSGINRYTNFALSDLSDEEIEAIYDIVTFHRDAILQEPKDTPNHENNVKLMEWLCKSKMGRIQLFEKLSQYENLTKTSRLYNRKYFLRSI